VLEDSWTKGGKARAVPVRTSAQRAALECAHRLAGRGSMIPDHRSYRQQLRVYERHTANAGLSRLRGLRHRYAQERYEALTGWKAQAAGGPRQPRHSATDSAPSTVRRVLPSARSWTTSAPRWRPIIVVSKFHRTGNC